VKRKRKHDHPCTCPSCMRFDRDAFLETHGEEVHGDDWAGSQHDAGRWVNFGDVEKDQADSRDQPRRHAERMDTGDEDGSIQPAAKPGANAANNLTALADGPRVHVSDGSGRGAPSTWSNSIPMDPARIGGGPVHAPLQHGVIEVATRILGSEDRTILDLWAADISLDATFLATRIPPSTVHDRRKVILTRLSRYVDITSPNPSNWTVHAGVDISTIPAFRGSSKRKTAARPVAGMDARDRPSYGNRFPEPGTDIIAPNGHVRRRKLEAYKAEAHAGVRPARLRHLQVLKSARRELSRPDLAAAEQDATAARLTHAERVVYLMAHDGYRVDACPASGMWQEFGLVLCWGCRLLDGVQVEVHWSSHPDRFVRSDPVEGVAVGLDLRGECRPVGDVESVEVFVLQRPERPLPHAVLLG
jgi:hypothetical protein